MRGLIRGPTIKGRAFTDALLRGLKPKEKPYKLAEHAPKGEGRLVVRVQPSGAKECFYRYRTAGGDTTLAIGRYDPTGKRGKTLADIRRDVGAVRKVQRDTGDAKAARKAEAQRAEAEARKGSLRQLLAAYVASLRAKGKPSATEAEAIFSRHVLRPFPVLAGTKAAAIEPGDIQRILARMVRAGIKRQVNKARSYLRAAFTYGAQADHDPRTAAAEGVLFGIKFNPAATVPRIAEYERAGDRTLTDDELRAYWLELQALPIVQRATLRFDLALAQQRPTQLLRAAWAAFDFQANTLLLNDSKGRGGAREHLLPLTDFALEQLQPLRDCNGDAAMPFTSDGARALVVETLSAAVADVSRALKRRDGVPPFQMRDIRRTTETMLQRLGVDKEVRAHLLSHGRSKGVQGKHYERYDFLPEKRAALEKWARHLERVITGKTAKVTAIHGATA